MINQRAFPSLERLLKTCFIIASLAVLSLWTLLGYQREWGTLGLVLSSSVVALVVWGCFSYVYQRVFSAFKRASMHLEAISNEDYLQYAKPAFQQGQIINFHNELENLSRHLQRMKSRYDKNIFLVYQLIEQLDSPIMVFNRFNQLTYANAAFEKLFSQPWQMYKYSSPELLGLEFFEHSWRFTASQKNSHWQIHHSEFIEQGKTHQLIVFTNIESALRKNQLVAWQQLIRVIGHEIHNSLTPISALAQGLSSKLSGPREQQALSVINERCVYLQDFVSRYASVSKPLQLNQQTLSIASLSKRLRELFKDINLDVVCNAKTIFGDATFIEQVLINVIKNAVEASSADNPIQLIFSQTKDVSLIKVIDQGHGFANLDNLFVPLYTTKQSGQGIGLSFCRNIVEHHQGVMDLVNNTNAPGVTVTISLPLGPLTTP